MPSDVFDTLHDIELEMEQRWKDAEPETPEAEKMRDWTEALRYVRRIREDGYIQLPNDDPR
jgi:hypothetical protein